MNRIPALYHSNSRYLNQTVIRRLNTLALRREDKSRWERRVALTPDDVSKLIKETGVKVYVQPCNKRVFSNEKYEQAGAVVQEDISIADVIMGIKEVPTKNLIPNKTHIFFSHTHKGQSYNMKMLQDILDKKIRLIDYELMTNEEKKRLVLFGTHAGYAGMIDGLHGLGLRLLGLGYNTSFMHIAMSHSYKSLDSALSSVKSVGESIATEGLPKDLGPMTFVFTGTGNVSNGAQEIFKHLPHEYIDAKDLKECTSTPHNYNNKKIYGCQVKLQDYLVHKNLGYFISKSDYYANPNEYECEFHTKIAPYTTMLIHGSYWDTRYPRLLTNEHLRAIQADPSNKNRLLAISDISCDINGALECLSHSTTIDDPFYYVDAVNNKEHKNDEGRGTQIMAVDILPTEIPLESSKHFSKSLYPFMNDLINGKIDQNSVLSRATIAKDGKLTDSHTDLYNLLPKSNNSISSLESRKDNKKILLLGSGFVAKPLVDYLSKQEDLSLIIASNMRAEAIALTRGNQNIQTVDLDVNKKEELSKLVQGADVVVSLLPAPLHPIVAEMCITHRKNMVTASYISSEMKALDERAKQAGITILNEIGVDPGIDHLSAMKIIDEVKAEGGEVTSFISWCGGLPAPEDSDVPLGYKFSWSPRGTLTATLNDASFWMNGKHQEIPGGALLKSHFPTVTIYPGLVFEGFANRDSLSYINTYGLAPLETKSAMFRGTLRYKGYSDLMYSFYKLGFLDTNTEESDFLDHKLFGSYNNEPTEASRISAIAEKLNLSKNHQMVEKVVDALKWLSLIPDSNTSLSSSLIPSTANTSTSLDTFCSLLQQKLQYKPGERDLLVLHHDFGIKLKNGEERTKTSTLVSLGSLDTYTAMAQLVGLPAAIATEMIVRGEIRDTGILAPTLPHIYNPILQNLDRNGVKIVENTVNNNRGMKGKLNWSGSGIWE
ncbi:alpha-aminoadipic semialdehyde synthase [Rhizophagus irregularis]|uniref:Alpha-aminoadipic semialdehyde synthase n=1 Tax=Rhizophagus irregularis TaxID=588596 RepID=A0A2N0PS42_9GLOM|nr:alpha-aminoadipic semialdehyde synthase [Rhizophagus irregularis]PKC66004.1 alpha-aminoadipic semialdehyde synthase [Rhizophagus irregularis]